MKTCSECIYADHPENGFYACRRFPRAVMARDGQPNVNMLPTMLGTEWCGEWKARRPWWKFW